MSDHAGSGDPTAELGPGHDAAALALRAIGLIDLTDLNDDTSADAVEALCERAVTHGTAAVCVWPDFVATASRVLAGGGAHDRHVEVATVVNFPTGDERAFAVGVIADRALADGATEIDVVLPYRAWSSGDERHAAAVLDRVRSAADGGGARVKVILESGMLPDQAAVARAAQFAIDHGADFIKTSTGKTETSATPDAVSTMLRVLAEHRAHGGREVGLKPSGGIRTPADAARYLTAADEVMGAGWVEPDTFRFGASGLLDALLAVLEGGAAPARPADY